MKRLGLALCLAAVIAAAQSRQVPPVIDGKLDDPVWKQLTPEPLAPSAPGVLPETGGDIRAFVLGRHIFVAARLPEPTGR